MLAGKGFTNVINMAGGIKGWNSETAVGPEDLGLALFTGKESLAEVLVIAYSLEKGLFDFYTSMAEIITDTKVRQLFKQLSTIEIKHQERVLAEYNKLRKSSLTRDQFEQQPVATMMEGGLTTEEYLALYKPDLDSVRDVVSLAMGIEGQALDLYQRAANRASDNEISKSLMKIADEERAHLRQLGTLLD